MGCEADRRSGLFSDFNYPFNVLESRVAWLALAIVPEKDAELYTRELCPQAREKLRLDRIVDSAKSK
jgi:hypothetical protein